MLKFLEYRKEVRCGVVTCSIDSAKRDIPTAIRLSYFYDKGKFNVDLVDLRMVVKVDLQNIRGDLNYILLSMFLVDLHLRPA